MKRVIAWIIVSVVVLALAGIAIYGLFILVTGMIHGDRDAWGAAGGIGGLIVGAIVVLAIGWAIAELDQ